MKYQIIYDILAGSCHRGWVRTTYERLSQLLGEPYYLDEFSPATWTLDFEDGTKASIYVYKSVEYGLCHGEIPSKEFNWHVGGFSRNAVIRVAEVLGVEPIFLDCELPEGPLDIPF